MRLIVRVSSTFYNLGLLVIIANIITSMFHNYFLLSMSLCALANRELKTVYLPNYFPADAA